MTADDFTRPERAAQIRQAKRYRSRIMRNGLCFACIHGETTLGVFHCRNREDRQHGACERDGQTPKFEFAVETLKKLADAA